MSRKTLRCYQICINKTKTFKKKNPKWIKIANIPRCGTNIPLYFKRLKGTKQNKFLSYPEIIIIN